MKDLLSGTWTLDEQRRWRFLCVKTVIFSNGKIIYEGDWSERLDGQKTRSGWYSYDPDDSELVLDHAVSDETGLLQTFHTECYRVECVDFARRFLQCKFVSNFEPVRTGC